MPESREKSRASHVAFKAAIRAIFDTPDPERARTVKNISNEKESIVKTPDMLQPLRRVTSKTTICSGTYSVLKEIVMQNETVSSPSCSGFLAKVSSSKVSNVCFQSTSSSSVQMSPASSSGYLSASSLEDSFECSGGKRTPRTSLAHPEFQNVKYKEPEKTSPYLAIDFFSPTTKSHVETCSTQHFNSRLLKKKDTSKKNSAALQPVNTLFSFNEGTYFDTHCHLDFLLNKADFNGSFADFKIENKDEFPLSFGGCIAVFCNPFSFKRISSWSKHLEGNVWASFGCHPKNAVSYNDSIEEDLIKALQHPKVCALGEIGLDYSERNLCSQSEQKNVFRRQLKIAQERKLPVVIHCRDAYDDCFEILREELPKDYLIHLHCFTDTWNVAVKFLKEFPNLYIGITNLVTFPSAVEVHEVVEKIPLYRLLLETDSPYFVPTPLSKSAKFAHPGMAIFVADKVASLKGVSLKEVIMCTRYNTNWVYGI